METEIPMYRTGPSLDALRPAMKAFHRTTPVHAVRISGPFKVTTLEGVMHCFDGWLAIDPKGNPYPIADDVFRATYQEVTPQ